MFFYNFSYLNFAIYFKSYSSSSLIFFFKGSGNARDRLIGIVDPKTSEDDAYKDVIVAIFFDGPQLRYYSQAIKQFCLIYQILAMSKFCLI